MPCRDYDDDRNYQANTAEVTRLQKRNDMLARISCKALDFIEEAARSDGVDATEVINAMLDKEERKWWSQHKAQEFQRRQAEEAERRDKMRKLVADLTPEEVEALKKQLKV